MENKQPLSTTIKEWGSLILSALGILFVISLLKKDDNDTTELMKDINDRENNIKDIENSDTTIEDIVDRWNNKGK